MQIVRRWWDFAFIKGCYEDQGFQIGISFWAHNHNDGPNHFHIEIGAGLSWLEIRIGRHQ